jgi:hypothetical protein
MPDFERQKLQRRGSIARVAARVTAGTPDPPSRRLHQIIGAPDPVVPATSLAEDALGRRELEPFSRADRGREESEDRPTLAVAEQRTKLGIQVSRDFGRTRQVLIFFLPKPARCVVEQNAQAVLLRPILPPAVQDRAGIRY